ncbi:MAG: hypothetical protein U9P71_07275 [Campylobacterota bacterium]|nr:hypothetical protein [Campylobacterota bacterium]
MRLVVFLLITLLLFGDEYDDLDFDTSNFEKKIFEYQGYIRSDNTLIYSDTTNREIVSSKNEFNLRADLDYEWVNLHGDYSYFYNKTEGTPSQNISTLNELYQHFGDEKNSLSVGKKVLRWGKGYAYSPLAFFERPKNPIYPELSREGYLMAHTNFTRTPSSFIDNYTLTLLAVPDTNDNRELFEHTDSKVAAKLYMLIGESDIDVIVANRVFGVDFSTNATTALELHGDFGYKESQSSYLAGLRYQSKTDVTIIAEYTKTFENDTFIYLKATQKEPFDIVYSSLYFVGIEELDDDAYRLQAGGTYDFKNGFTGDVTLLATDESYGGKFIVYYYF